MLKFVYENKSGNHKWSLNSKAIPLNFIPKHYSSKQQTPTASISIHLKTVTTPAANDSGRKRTEHFFTST